MTDTFLARTEVRVTRSLSAPPDRVFRAFLDPDDMSAWMWGPGVDDVRAEADPRVGGAYRVTLPARQPSEWPGPRHGVMGVFVDIDAPRRLVYTVHWDADVGYNRPGQLVLDEVVVVHFTLDGSGTKVDLCHMGIPDDGFSAREHTRGIEAMVDALAAHLEGGSLP
jgi:uncharacterized protein YndB with AHSA1/START domain